jgi:hypothetical protein
MQSQITHRYSLNLLREIVNQQGQAIEMDELPTKERDEARVRNALNIQHCFVTF